MSNTLILCFLQVVHWQSPHMHAYFPALTSWPSLLGDMLADAINCIGFTWVIYICCGSHLTCYLNPHNGMKSPHVLFSCIQSEKSMLFISKIVNVNRHPALPAQSWRWMSWTGCVRLWGFQHISCTTTLTAEEGAYCRYICRHLWICGSCIRALVCPK